MSLDAATTARLDHHLATLQRDGRLPSVAAGLTRKGELVWTGAVGTVDGRADGTPVDADTQYRMGSITKPIVAVAVMQLRDAGRLDLSDRFEQHVPGSQLGQVTIEQLLSHAAGTQAETNGPWWERTPGGDWNDLANSPVGQRFRAGRRFHYSNVGFGALGELVARAHGTDWFSVIQRDVLEPLGMVRTSTRPERAASGLAVHPFADLVLPEPEHDAGAMAPAGQLWTTVQDLAKFAIFLGGDTGDVLAKGTLDEMVEPHHVVDMPGAPWQGAHGLGFQVWNIDGRRYAGHGGSMPGFLAGLRVSLEGGDGAVTFTNSTSGALGPGASALLDLFQELAPAPIVPWHADASLGHADHLELLGTWHWGAGVTIVKRAGAHLVLGDPGVGRGSRFAPAGSDEWIGLDGYYTGEPLRVVRREDGSVSHLDLASFRFTRTPYAADADVPGGVDEGGWR